MPLIHCRKPYHQLSDFEKGRIIGLFEAGWEYGKISEKVYRYYSTVKKICEQWKKEGTYIRKSGSGAPRKTTSREDRRIVKIALASRKATTSQIRKEVASRTTRQTINNRLLEVGLHSRAPMKCLPLTQIHRKKRYQWCNDKLTWTHEWNKVVFSDESRFCFGQSDGRKRVRRRAGERGHPLVILESHSYKTSGVMVWGAISYDSKSELVVINGTLNASKYVDEILEPVVKPFMRTIEKGIFQQDNAPPHTASVSMIALQEVNTMTFPPRSADLSIIEHVWSHMKHRINCYSNPPNNNRMLVKMLQEIWSDIPQDYIKRLYNSLPNRIRECVASKGGHTHY
jgi:transposase